MKNIIKRIKRHFIARRRKALSVMFRGGWEWAKFEIENGRIEYVRDMTHLSEDMFDKGARGYLHYYEEDVK